MKNKLRRLLAITLTLTIVISVGITDAVFISKITGKNPKAVSIEEFCIKINEFNKEYNTDNSESAYIMNGEHLFSSYENRLIIKTDNELKSSCTDSVYYDDIAVLQYDDKNTMQLDYDNFKSNGFTISKDHVFFTCADAKAGYDYTNNTNYAYADSGALYALEQFADADYPEITVAVIDTGIDYTHSVFEGRYIDNRINFSTSGESDDPMDDGGHGTATSSIIVMSSPKNVKVKPYKVLNSSGSCTCSEIVAACEYILSEKNRPNIVNMSIGGYDLLNLGGADIESYIISKLIDNGITVCAAAGNEEVCCDYGVPASCEGVITASSHGSEFKFSDYSDYGESVDICAPGEKVLTAKLNGNYTSEQSGTSFSAPFASSACAYILMQHPDYSPAEIKEKLKSTAVKPSKYDELYFGSGILSFANIIEDKEIETPKPSASPGIYHEAQTISFDVPENYSLVYSTDELNAVTPSLNSAVYTEPITVESDIIITYALVKDGKYASPIESAEYEIQYYADENDFVMSDNEIKEYTGGKKNIIIPDTINGAEPKSYTDKTHTYTHIVFPDSIKEIGTLAFSENKKLRTITAHGVYSLNGKKNFYNCEYLHKADMPNLQYVTEDAFSGCKRLHSINFAENITQLKSNLFKDSGIIKLNLPNAQIDPDSNIGVFSTPNLVECYAPKISDFGQNMFYGCKLLYKFSFGEVKSLGDSAIYNCPYFMNLDVSKLEKMHTNALYGCMVENFYAPNITKFEEDGGIFGYFCYSKILNLPNFEGKLERETLYDSKLEYIYLDKVKTMASRSMVNCPFLKRIYLPLVTKFYSPEYKSNVIMGITIPNPCAGLPSPEIIWIPNASSTGTLNFENLGCIFAPKLTTSTIKIKAVNTNAVIIANMPATETSIRITCSLNGTEFETKPLLVTSNRLETTDGLTYNTAIHDECNFLNPTEDNCFEYKCRDYNFTVPFDFAEKSWSENEINLETSASKYKFVFDFTNDKLINARDFAVYSKALHNKAI